MAEVGPAESRPRAEMPPGERGPRAEMPPGEQRPRRAVICAGCALLCDDAEIAGDGGALALTPPCPLGSAWLSERAEPARDPVATVGGAHTSVSAALARAAGLLRSARRPLICGFGHASVEDVRAALALADRLGALVAPAALSGLSPGGAAESLRGVASATLGEVRDRAQLLVIWREDPEQTHPRLLERLGVGGPPPRLGFERTLVVVDDRDTATAARAQLRLGFGRERDLEALAILGLLARGRNPRAGELSQSLGELHERICAAGHVAFVHGAGLAGAAGGQRRALALHELVRAHAAQRRAVTLALPANPGAIGAREALTWQTGYGTGVDFASGRPEPLWPTRALPDGEDVDVLVAVEPARAPVTKGAALIALASVPPAGGAEVWVRTAPLGLRASGSAHRLDGVPLSLGAVLGDGEPSAGTLLARLNEELDR
jgi:formylmethanofuran dehydrogenase subunit B